MKTLWKDFEWANLHCIYLFNYGLYFAMAENHIRQRIFFKTHDQLKSTQQKCIQT